MPIQKILRLYLSTQQLVDLSIFTLSSVDFNFDELFRGFQDWWLNKGPGTWKF